MSVSKTYFIGRLTKDPELKYIKVKGEDTAVCNFTVAVDEDFGDETDFIDVVVWRKPAENAAKFLGKGRLVYVEGRLKQRTYPVTKEGVEFNGRSTEVRADKVQYLDKAPDAGQGQTGGQAAPYTAPATNSGPAPF